MFRLTRRRPLTPDAATALSQLRPLRLRATNIAALCVLAIAISACGGGAATPGVASLGSTTTTTAVAGSTAGNKATDYADAVAYASCMRHHGVVNMPDPTSEGDFLSTKGKINGQSVDTSSPQYIKADKACSHLLPNGGVMTPAEQQQVLARALKFVQCLRTHGLPNTPDPVTAGGGIALKISAGGPDSAAFQAAQKACRSVIPLGGS